MAGYNGRRAPNFSQYLDDLNAIPSPYDQALQQQQRQENTFNVDEELALFTNAEFLDFDKFGGLNLPTFDPVEDKTTHETTQSDDLKFLDFLNDGLGNMTQYPQDLSAVNAQSMHMHNAPYSAISPVSNDSVATNSVSVPTPSVSSAHNVGQAPTAAAAGPKRKNTQKSTQASAEEAAQNIAEEDKRRRNTAASARFRVKKKMREAALERTVKETTDKNDILEARVSQLELENHWLRGLIMEKNGTGERNEASEKAISDMFKTFLASRKPESSRSESKRGVGTLA